MADPKREKLEVKRKTAILAAVIDPASAVDKSYALEELTGLVKTAGVQVVDQIVQTRESPHPGLCLGRGKLEELKSMIRRHDVQLVVFDNNLTPAQGKTLETETQTVIVDRSEVILDIFATTARTYEAKLQVELAQLLYFRPRLKRMWTHLERIEGGIGTGRGPGEKQLETDRRLVDKRIAELKRRLKDVEKRRKRTVQQRSDQPTVSLVGYTNAGKSTLLNALTSADVFVADKLFATLDTRTRRWTIPRWGEVLLSDTVGFVRDLPHHLVASFRSTLEEARHAELLMHVVDSSHSQAEHQVETVYQVLEEIGVDCSNVLLVLNKTDAADRASIDVLRRRFDNSIAISAVNGTGLDELAAAVSTRLSHGFVDACIETNVGNGRLFSYLAEHAEVHDTRYHDDSRVTLECRIPQRFFESIANGDGTVVTIQSVDRDGK